MRLPREWLTGIRWGTVTRPNVDADHSSTQGLSREQAKALLAVARRDGPRSFALVSLLMFTGVRISEALQASTADYGHDAGHRTLSIRRKGGRSAKVAVPAPAVVALNSYLGTSGADLVVGQPRSLPLFATSTGRPWQRSEAFRTVQRLAAGQASRARSAPTACGIRSPPLLWTAVPRCTPCRTAWATRIRGPPEDMTGPGTTC